MQIFTKIIVSELEEYFEMEFKIQYPFKNSRNYFFFKCLYYKVKFNSKRLYFSRLLVSATTIFIKLNERSDIPAKINYVEISNKGLYF